MQSAIRPIKATILRLTQNLCPLYEYHRYLKCIFLRKTVDCGQETNCTGHTEYHTVRLNMHRLIQVVICTQTCQLRNLTSSIINLTVYDLHTLTQVRLIHIHINIVIIIVMMKDKAIKYYVVLLSVPLHCFFNFVYSMWDIHGPTDNINRLRKSTHMLLYSLYHVASVKDNACVTTLPHWMIIYSVKINYNVRHYLHYGYIQFCKAIITDCNAKSVLFSSGDFLIVYRKM